MTKNPYWIGCLLLCSLIATFTTAKADTIHEAAVDGDVERVEQLLIGGADVNAPDADDEGTPLQWAMFTNQTNVVRLLLGVRCQSQHRWTARNTSAGGYFPR